MIRVLIVEDDFHVAEINRQMTEQVSDFKVVKIAGTAQKALQSLHENHIDLVILDVYLPDTPGVEILKDARKLELPVDFILITAAQDTKTIEESLRFGIVDYLIKPVEMVRYQKALIRYAERKTTLQNQTQIKQGELDTVQYRTILPYLENAAETPRLPKGISFPTLQKMKEIISKELQNPFTIDDAAELLFISRITAHRYLEYLQRSGFILKDVKYNKVGRPTAVYSVPLRKTQN